MSSLLCAHENLHTSYRTAGSHWAPASPFQAPRAGISSALLDPATTVSSSCCCFPKQGGWALWKISCAYFLCWNTCSLYLGCDFLFEIDSKHYCPSLDSSIKDVVHLHLCLLAKLQVWKHPCGCGCFLWKSHHRNANYHPIWFICTCFVFWLCTAWVQWQSS